MSRTAADAAAADAVEAVTESDPADRTVTMEGVEKITVTDGLRTIDYAPRSGRVRVEPGHVGVVLAHFPDATVVEDKSVSTGAGAQ